MTCIIYTKNLHLIFSFINFSCLSNKQIKKWKFFTKFNKINLFSLIWLEVWLHLHEVNNQLF